MRQQLFVWFGTLVLLAAACGPAASPTSVPQATATPRLTAVATSTPLPPSGTRVSATPTPAASAAPRGPAEAKPKYGGTVTTALRTDPQDWDPHAMKSGYRDARLQHNMVFSGLITNPAVPEVPSCAASSNLDALEKWEWTDPTTLALKLRQGINFVNQPPVNGREATANDVVFSLKRGIFEEPMRGVELVSKMVTDIKAVDRYTVRITFKRPTPQFIDTVLSNYYGALLLPPEARNVQGFYRPPETAYKGTGPFMFKEWRTGVHVLYERNPNYWKKGLPYVDSVKMMIIPDQSTRAASLRSGKLDIWAGEIPTPMALGLQKTSPEIETQGCPMDSGFGYLWMQAGVNAVKPFDDVRVRRAVNMAIDREGMTKSALMGYGVDTPFAAIGFHEWYLSTNDYPPEIRKYISYDPAEAKKLLLEAGYPNGFDTEVEWTTRFGSPGNEMVESIIADLNKVGIRAKLYLEEYVAYLDRGTKAGFKPLRMGKPTTWTDPWRVMSRLHSQNALSENKAGISDPVLDKLIDELLVTMDVKRQKELAAQIQYRAIDQAWVVSVPQPMDWTADLPRVKDFKNTGNLHWAYTWLERVWLDK